MIEYTVMEPMFHDTIFCENIVEANSLLQAIHEIIELSKQMKQRIIEITNYYWVGE